MGLLVHFLNRQIYGDNIMGRRISEIFFVIVFFPITIIFFIFKHIFRKLHNKKLSNYLSSITLENIDALSGVEFEDFMYYLLTSLGLNVKKTKKSHDYGADLIINLRDKTIVVQCKLYNKHSVGNSAVQEVYTATNYYNASLGMIVTNSFFTKPAIILAEKSGIKLWNRDTLGKLINLNSRNKRTLRKKLINEIS